MCPTDCEKIDASLEEGSIGANDLSLDLVGPDRRIDVGNGIGDVGVVVPVVLGGISVGSGAVGLQVDSLHDMCLRSVI